MKQENHKFWYETKTGIKINMTQLYRFLSTMGILIVKLNESWFYIEIKHNIIREIDETFISQFLKNHIRSLDIDQSEIDDIEETLRYKISRIIAKDQLMLLDDIELNLKKDDKETCYIYYKNKWLQITKDQVKSESYGSLDGQVWKKKILSREFKLIDSDREKLVEDCDFAKFIWNVSNKKTERFESLCSIIGYMIHEYKDPSENKAIILMDEVISDNPEGGTGKGIVMNALSQIREMIIQDGKNFTFNSRFSFQDVSHSTSILTFDDVKINFDIERLFSVMTDGLSVEQKGKKRFRIDKDDIPKTLISTNYVIKGRGNSHERRRCEFEFSQHYNGVNTPLDEFGKLFFSEWDRDQWSLFDNFIIRCVQFYLERGLIQVKPINLLEKKIQFETCPEFVDFISYYSVNIKYNRKDLQEVFDLTYPEISDAKWYFSKTFINWLKKYASHMGYTYMTSRVNGGETYFTYHQEIAITEVKSPEQERVEKDLSSEKGNEEIKTDKMPIDMKLNFLRKAPIDRSIQRKKNLNKS